MSMTIADLFVNIGVKGADSTAKSFAQVDNGIKNIATSSLAAKAAIVGVIYAMERMLMGSANIGSELYTFESATGQSAVTLQKYQKALLHAGASTDDTIGTMRNLNKVMMDFARNGQAPTWFKTLETAVGFDPSRARDTFYVFDQIQKYVKSRPADVSRGVFGGLLSDDMLKALKKARNEIQLMKGDFFGEHELQNLERIKNGLEEFGLKLKMFGGHLVSKYGMVWIDDLTRAFAQVEKISKKLDSITPKYKAFFDTIGTAAVGIAATLAPVTSAIVGLVWILGEWDKKEKNQPSIFGDGKNEKVPGWMKAGNSLMQSITSMPRDDGGYYEQWERLKNGDFKGFLAPQGPLQGPTDTSKFPAPVNMNIQNHIHTDTKTPEKHSEIIKREINLAFRQSSSQGQLS